MRHLKDELDLTKQRGREDSTKRSQSRGNSMGVNEKHGATTRNWEWPQHKVQGRDGGKVAEDQEWQDREPDLGLNKGQLLE